MPEREPLPDPYALHPESIEEPPISLFAAFRRIGPGVILASSIVGSGELVATTVLGAESGYSLLWLILVSCAIKVIIQNEIGRYTIGTGETILEAFNRVPGPHWRVSWVVWLWALMLSMIMFATGGMMGAIGEVFHTLVPALPINAWVWIINVATVVLLIIGRYGLIERLSMFLVGGFTLLTVSCAFLLVKRPEFFSLSAAIDGLTFNLPAGGFATAVTVFGATGVGAGELVAYPYWCIEKGYARFAGPQEQTTAWQRRARGWIRVMGLDVVNSLVIYTFATVAFYLLGAGILHGKGVIPQGNEMVGMLSSMYTEILGSSSHTLFLIGAVVVFYSTVFASTASQARMTADFLGMLGIYDRHDYHKRLRTMRIAVVVLMFLPSLYFTFLQEPVFMVKMGGVSQALMLPVIGLATVYLRYRRLPKAILPKGWITLGLWISSLLSAVMMAYFLIHQATGL